MANENKRSPFTKALSFIDLSGIPGPRGLAYINFVRAFQRDILGSFTRANLEFGEIASFPWPMNSVIIYSPELIKKVLVDDNRKYIKGEQIEELRAVVGDGLATNNDHESWLQSRKLMAREFSKKSMLKFYKTFAAEVNSHFAQSAHNEIDICEEFKALTFKIACLTILGKRLSVEEGEIVSAAVDYTSIVVYERIFQFFPIPYWVPTTTNVKFNAHYRNLNRIVRNLISEQRASAGERQSILGMLVESSDEETGYAFSDTQLRDEILTLLLAGHETSAHSLTWICGLLARHPEIQERLMRECRDVTSDDFEAITSLTYLRQVMNEAMRLYPAFPVLSRKTREDLELGPYKLEKGTNVVLPIYVTQRSREYWDFPEVFNPDRFAGEAGAAIEKSYKFLPFSRGPRRCLAELFAMDEMAIIVHHLVTHFKLELLAAELPVDVAYVSLKPVGGMRMRLVPRETSK